MTAESNLDPVIQAVLRGDREAYREVITQCEAKVRVILAAILPDSNAVEDLAQEVFVTAYSKLHLYEPGTDLVLWIKAIARNLALNERRRWLRQTRFRDRFEAELETSIEPLVLSYAENHEHNALDALRECLAELQQPARDITQNFYFEDLSTEQLARRLGKKAAWVRLILFRARAALGLCLQKKGIS